MPALLPRSPAQMLVCHVRMHPHVCACVHTWACACVLACVLAHVGVVRVHVRACSCGSCTDVGLAISHWCQASIIRFWMKQVQEKWFLDHLLQDQNHEWFYRTATPNGCSSSGSDEYHDRGDSSSSGGGGGGGGGGGSGDLGEEDRPCGRSEGADEHLQQEDHLHEITTVPQLQCRK